MHETSTGERVPARAITGLIQDSLAKLDMPAEVAAAVAAAERVAIA